jgi:hypothetical protein
MLLSPPVQVCIKDSAYIMVLLTSLSFKANIIALVCSAAFPTIGRMITLMNAIGMFHEAEAP